MYPIWTFILAVCASLFILYLTACFLKYIKHCKAIEKIPGPRTFSFLGNLPQLMGDNTKLWNTLRSFAKEYKHIYTIWSGPIPSVNLLSPEDVEMLISTTKHSEKSLLYNILQPWLGTGLLTSFGDKWQFRRKLLTQAFHFNILQQFIIVFVTHSDYLIDQLRSESGKPTVNVLPFITEYTLGTICETAMGTQICVENNENNYRDAVYRIGKLFCYRAIRPWLYNDWIFQLTTTHWRQRKIAKILHNFSRNVIETRSKNIRLKDMNNVGEENSKIRLAMLDLLLLARESGANIDEEGIREEVDTFMFEGHDTTAMAICFTLMLIACNPGVQELIIEELQSVLKDDPFNPSYQQLNELKYLERVIKETLRLYPSVPFISRKTSEDMATPSGYYIPKGTYVHVSIFDMHRDAKYFPHPEMFDPDRFLPENSKDRHPFAYIPFSAGPRNCIGQKFAILEMKTVLSAILRNFTILPIDTPDTLKLHVDIIIRTVNGVRIQLRPRTHN